MTMDDDSSNPAVFPPNLREELEKSEIEVCKRKELVTVGQFYNIFPKIILVLILQLPDIPVPQLLLSTTT
jgi:hypothetical protein